MCGRHAGLSAAQPAGMLCSAFMQATVAATLPRIGCWFVLGPPAVLCRAGVRSAVLCRAADRSSIVVGAQSSLSACAQRGTSDWEVYDACGARAGVQTLLILLPEPCIQARVLPAVRQSGWVPSMRGVVTGVQCTSVLAAREQQTQCRAACAAQELCHCISNFFRARIGACDGRTRVCCSS